MSLSPRLLKIYQLRDLLRSVQSLARECDAMVHYSGESVSYVTDQVEDIVTELNGDIEYLEEREPSIQADRECEARHVAGLQAWRP